MISMDSEILKNDILWNHCQVLHKVNVHLKSDQFTQNMDSSGIFLV